MPLDIWINKPVPPVPAEIAQKIEDKGTISLTPFAEKNAILSSARLQHEAGYRKFADGGYLVSMYCEMPNITADMIQWWFWWHAQSSERYCAWFPGEHFSTAYHKKDAPYFAQSTCPAFQANTQYPTERIGTTKMPLRIDFVAPESFGFSASSMQQNDIPLIVCAHVGAYKGAVWHTEMAHIFKQTQNGLFMISRFWMGESLHNPLLKKLFLTDKMAEAMATHCCMEYRNLLQILPPLYQEFAKQ